MTLNLILVSFVFIIGYGWGVATALVVYYKRVNQILDHCTKILRFSGTLLASDEKTREMVREYAEVTHKSFNASFDQNEKLLQGLRKLVEAVREEAKANETTGPVAEGDQED